MRSGLLRQTADLAVPGYWRLSSFRNLFAQDPDLALSLHHGRGLEASRAALSLPAAAKHTSQLSGLVAAPDPGAAISFAAGFGGRFQPWLLFSEASTILFLKYS